MELQQFAVHWVSVLSTSGLYSGNYFEVCALNIRPSLKVSVLLV
jgi:hypothetical protein